jgi:hypothetical protein
MDNSSGHSPVRHHATRLEIEMEDRISVKTAQPAMAISLSQFGNEGIEMTEVMAVV